jgi:hypothetical protein
MLVVGTYGGQGRNRTAASLFRVEIMSEFNYLAWIIHEHEDVILSAAPAKNFRPAFFAGRAGAQSKDLRLFPTV